MARALLIAVFPVTPTDHAPERLRSLRDLEEVASSRIIATVLRHVRLIWPLGLIVVGLLLWLDASVWRFMLVTGAATSILVLSSVARGRWRGARLSSRQIAAIAWVSGLAQLTVVFVVGGIAGPIAPGLPLIAVVMNLFAPGRIAMGFVLGAQIPAVWLFAAIQSFGWVPELVPEAWHGLYAPPGTPGAGPWVGAMFMTLVLLGALTFGRAIRGVLVQMLREQIEDRDRELALYEDSTRALGQMSAEIAHELKNPLASIKGLAALVRKDLEGTPAERMDVLRREVDRLQGILEEFLSYSRPLVPIDEERVDLGALVAEVVALHEGIARQREVDLTAAPGEVHLRCDPRKIKRVLINLVQNAIEASPHRGAVRVEIERDPTGARIRVLDEGSGLAPGADEKLFTVGFTTKDDGTGIGLALARGLARQHGGELAIENRPEGGCVATLSLPNEPRAADAREVAA